MTQADSSRVARLKTVGITLPIDLVQKARKYGLNISFLARRALQAEIQRIEAKKLRYVKKRRGVKANTELVRMLITEEFERLGGKTEML